MCHTMQENWGGRGGGQRARCWEIKQECWCETELPGCWVCLAPTEVALVVQSVVCGED